MLASETWTSESESQGRICKICLLVREREGEVYGCTLRFHHHPNSVPCMSHVSTPMSANVAR